MSSNRAQLLALAFLSGVCGIAYELVYARLLTTYLGDMFHVAAAILATFLLGIAVGARVAHRFARFLWAIEIAIGGYALAIASWIASDGDGFLEAALPLASQGPAALVATGVRTARRAGPADRLQRSAFRALPAPSWSGGERRRRVLPGLRCLQPGCGGVRVRGGVLRASPGGHRRDAVADRAGECWHRARPAAGARAAQSDGDGDGDSRRRDACRACSPRTVRRPVRGQCRQRDLAAPGVQGVRDRVRAVPRELLDGAGTRAGRDRGRHRVVAVEPVRVSRTGCSAGVWPRAWRSRRSAR